MKLIQTYKQILSVAGLSVDDEGLVSVMIENDPIPYMVNKKRLVLPIKEHLANPDPDNKFIFHPFSENVLRGESELMVKFRNAITIRNNYVIGCLLEELVLIGTSVKQHAQLSPEQSELLTVLKEADEKTLDVMKSLIQVVESSIREGTLKDKGFVYTYLKRGAKLDGVSYGRAAIVSFPLYEELVKGGKKVFDVTIRAKDRQMLLDLFQFIFIGIEKEGSYSRGSVSDVAPFLDALMLSVIGIASNINRIVDSYDSVLVGKDYRYNDEWVDVFENVAQMLPEIRSIPMQAGNEGVVEKVVTTNQVQNPSLITPDSTQPIHYQSNNATYIQPVTNQQVQAPNPNNVVLDDNGSISFSATMRSRGVVPNQQLFMGGQQSNYSQTGRFQPQPQYGQQQQMFNQPVYGQPPQLNLTANSIV